MRLSKTVKALQGEVIVREMSRDQLLTALQALQNDYEHLLTVSVAEFGLHYLDELLPLTGDSVQIPFSPAALYPSEVQDIMDTWWGMHEGFFTRTGQLAGSLGVLISSGKFTAPVSTT